MNKERLASLVVDLYELVAKLRGPGGCPWDAEQTNETIKMYLLEEAYEVLEAIEEGSSEDVLGELGDLFFQIIFLARLAEEKGEFNLTNVMEKIKQKMINRHPHVFGQLEISSPQEVSENWDKIKKQERGELEDQVSVLQSIPNHLPALLRSHRLIERASKMGIGRRTAEEVWEDIDKGIADLRDAFVNQDREIIGQRIGDLLFDLVNLSRFNNWNPEHLLRTRNKLFLNHCEKDNPKEEP
jgi:MazG family protein